MSLTDPRRFSPDEADALIAYTMRVTGMRSDDLRRRVQEVNERAQGRALRLAAERWAKAHGEILFLRTYAGPVDRALVERVHAEYERACAALVEQTDSIAGKKAATVERGWCTCATSRHGERILEVSCPLHRPPMPAASAITTEIPAIPPAHRTRRRLPLRFLIVAGLFLFALIAGQHATGWGG